MPDFDGDGATDWISFSKKDTVWVDLNQYLSGLNSNENFEQQLIFGTGEFHLNKNHIKID